jgi:Uncharacterized membrane protein (homolog of Drosophila rhomboid)
MGILCGSAPLDRFALSVEGLRHGYVWQLLTFQFMHGGILHLLLNSLAIFMFGREVEQSLGKGRMLTLYFASGVIGGLVQALAGVLFHGRFAAPVVGASAGAFGLIAAFATLYPDRSVTLLVFYVLPVNLRAKFLLLFCAVLAVVGMFIPKSTIADAAHLGGMAVGIFFVRYAAQWRWGGFRSARGRPVRRLVKVHSQNAVPWGQATDIEAEELDPEEFLAREVDPILDKITACGINSLTERERKILETARRRMGKR